MGACVGRAPTEAPRRGVELWHEKARQYRIQVRKGPYRSASEGCGVMA